MSIREFWQIIVVVWLVIVLFMLILCAGVCESTRLKRLSDKVELRILVNGTRGKSSTARMLIAALNGCGIRTFGKTTGSAARFIFPDLTEEPVPRRHGVRLVREHTLLFDKAVRCNARAVVCECMAIREESQTVVGSRLVRPSITIITNARVDHVDQMGDTEESTAQVLCKCIGPSKDVYTADKNILSCIAADKTVRVHESGHLREELRPVLQRFSFPVYEENLALVLDVCRDLGLDEAKVIDSVIDAVPDFGMTGQTQARGHNLINGFASNDPKSARKLFDGLEPADVTVIYNNRADREFRLPIFRDLLADLGISDLVVIGDNAAKCRRFFSRSIKDGSVRTVRPKDMTDGFWDSCRKNIVCMGNIKGAGERVLDMLQQPADGE
ncbi:MAG: poly-gamma-glutamate synthase PgsB [Spirochaetales bacterium]|nr:poly-gamma-glutamate synthase PgsB [Spirochaetales bacterium]